MSKRLHRIFRLLSTAGTSRVVGPHRNNVQVRPVTAGAARFLRRNYKDREIIRCIVCGTEDETPEPWVLALDAWFCPKCIPDGPPGASDETTA